MPTILPFDIELGIFAGLAVAIAGYLKAYSRVGSDGKREKFSFQRFLITVLVGAIVAGFVTYLAQIDDAVLIFLSTAGTVVIVENLIKAFLRTV